MSGPRLLSGARDDGSADPLADHLARHGPVPAIRPTTLIELVEASGLTGRGGGGFPAGQKLRAVAGRRGRSVVLANGTEGEPLAKKDKALLRAVPHLVLDGIALAAAAVGADAAILAVSRESERELAVLQRALAERARSRIDRVEVQLSIVPQGFVAGEETALISWLNGKAAKPTLVPPRPYERGVNGRPTLVQNVETLAQLALIGRYGVDSFRAAGTREEPGSALVSLSGAVARPGVYEIELGMRLGELLDWAGGLTEPVDAMLVGGYFGSWIDASRAVATPLLEATLRPLGASLGARAIVALPRTVCGISETARVARYLADESAGQCGPCLHGLATIAGALQRLAVGEPRGTERLHVWLEQIEGRGACRHPDGAARLIASALRTFRDELALHRAGRCSGDGRRVLPTPAGVEAAIGR